MNELVCKINDDCRDLTYIERTRDGRKNVYEVNKPSQQGNCHRNYASPIAELDARNKPGYRSKNKTPVQEFKSNDYAEPLSILRKERYIKKINVLSVILLIVVAITALLLVLAPSTVMGIIFALSLTGFVIHQLLHKEVVVEPKVLY